MTAEKADASAAYENPLIPNARLRQLYRGILRVHLLGRALPPAQRALTASREAALVSTSIDLTARDLISDALATPVIDFLRGTPLNRALHPKSKSNAGRILADCGSASRLPAPADPATRILFALGAAAALKSAAALAKSVAEAASEEEATDPGARDSSVVLFYTLPNEIPAAVWKSSLSFAAGHDLPIVFVVLPATQTQKSSARAAKNPALRVLAHQAHVPAIPVDAADPVALYRVAQESIGHARIGGGPALIECIAFALESPSARPTTPKPASSDGAIATLAQYILSRRIVTERWMDQKAKSFTAHLANLKTASK
jgi:hypothetical protein